MTGSTLAHSRHRAARLLRDPLADRLAAAAKTRGVGRPDGVGPGALGPSLRLTSVLKRKTQPQRGFTRGERRDLNPRPPGPQPGALPAELRPPSGAEV